MGLVGINTYSNHCVLMGS